MAIVLIVLFSIIAAVLLIPFHVKLYGTFSQSARKFEVALSWLGITIYRVKPTESKPKEEKKKPKEEEPKKRQFSIGKTLELLSTVSDSVPAFLILIRSFRRAVHIQHLVMDFTFGLGDPADTAMMSGYIWSVSWILNFIPSVSLSFRPDFEQVKFDGSIQAEARVRTLFLVIGFLRAYSKNPFRKLIKEVRSRR